MAVTTTVEPTRLRRWRSIKGRITGWPLLAVVPVAVFQQVRIDTLNLGWTPSESAGVAVAGLLGFALVTLVAWVLTRHRRVGILTAGIVWAAATVARLVMITLVPMVWGFAESRPPAQLPALAVSTFAVAMAVWVFSERQHEHREALNELGTARALLDERVRRDATLVAQVRSDVRDAVQRQVQPVLDACATIMQSPRSDDDSARWLRRSIDDVIRPMSQQLIRPPDAELPRLNPPPTRTSRAERLRYFQTQAVRRDVLRPAWPLTVVGVFTALSLGSIRDLASPGAVFLGGVAATAASIALVWAAWWSGVRPRSGWPLPWLGVLLAYAIMGLLTVVTLGALPLTAGSAPVTLYLLLIVVSGVIGSLLFALGVQQRRTRAQLADSLSAIAALESRLRREAWFERRRLASVLHGRVQSRLVAAAAHLVEDANDPVSIRQVRHHIDEAVEALVTLRESETGALADPISALEEIASIWVSRMRIELRVDPADLRRWPPATAAAVLDIVTEAVLNARKHGEATDVVVLASETNSIVHLEVSNNGAPPDEPIRPGAGMEFLDVIADHWSLTESATGGAVLKVQLG